MPARTDRATPEQVSDQFGVPIDSALERRERFANRYDIDFGRERVFPDLVEALLAEVPEGGRVVEIGAATGLLTEPLLARAGHVTAMEPSEGMLWRLLAKEASDVPTLRVIQGMAEDLSHNELFDVAVVTFTPRRGLGLLRLLEILALHVTSSVVMLLDDDASMDWAYLARTAAAQGFDVRLRFVSDRRETNDSCRRAIVLVAELTDWAPTCEQGLSWEFQARTVDVPYPAPRGTATRLIRYFLAGGDRALLLRTDRAGAERLYGNLRTAAHRLGREEITVRRVDEGVQVVRLPRAAE